MVTLWQSSLSSSSSSLNVHVKYSTEYENCCWWWSPSASSQQGLWLRFCFRFGFIVLSEVARCTGRGRKTWRTSSASLLSPVWLAMSWCTGKTILRQIRSFWTGIFWNDCHCRIGLYCCGTTAVVIIVVVGVLVLRPVLPFPLLVAEGTTLDEVLESKLFFSSSLTLLAKKASVSPWGQCYKTFVCNLRIIALSLCLL